MMSNLYSRNFAYSRKYSTQYFLWLRPCVLYQSLMQATAQLVRIHGIFQGMRLTRGGPRGCKAGHRTLHPSEALGCQ